MKIARLLVASAACLSSAAALADAPTVEAANDELFLGAGGQHLHYTEYLGSNFLDGENGKQIAYWGGASWQGQLMSVRDVYAQGQFSFSRGTTQYNGYLQSVQGQATVPYVSRTDDETSDWQLRLGKGFVDPWNTGILTPFLQLGDHRWVRNGAPTDPHGYLEIYKHKSVEAGLLAQGALSRRIVASLEIDGGTTFGATLTAPSRGFSAALGKERVLGCGAGLDVALLPQLHMRLDVHDTSFRYRQSKPINGLIEPDSTTVQAQGFLSFALSY